MSGQSSHSQDQEGLISQTQSSVQDSKNAAEQRLAKLQHQTETIQKLHAQAVNQLGYELDEAKRINKEYRRLFRKLEQKHPFKLLIVLAKKLKPEALKKPTTHKARVSTVKSPPKGTLPKKAARKTATMGNLLAYAHKNVELTKNKTEKAGILTQDINSRITKLSHQLDVIDTLHKHCINQLGNELHAVRVSNQEYERLYHSLERKYPFKPLLTSAQRLKPNLKKPAPPHSSRTSQKPPSDSLPERVTRKSDKVTKLTEHIHKNSDIIRSSMEKAVINSHGGSITNSSGIYITDNVTAMKHRAAINATRNDIKEEFLAKSLDKQSDTFVLYRIIGNDLCPRHKKGQSRQNLEFILKHEPPLQDCQKIFVINRIFDQDEEATIINMIEAAGYEYIHLPFVEEEYQKIGFDFDCLPEPGYFATPEFAQLEPERQERARTAVYRHKNNYIMNNNGARNVALRDGKKRAKWVLPWDGNCFITAEAWQRLRADVAAAPYFKYFTTPMVRLLDNRHLLTGKDMPEPDGEPQLLFRNDAREEFDENFCYGRRPKVELLWRLGVPGEWDSWPNDPWDRLRPALAPESHQFGVTGWVARLFSGKKELETGAKSIKGRGLARNEAILTTIRYIDASFSRQIPEDLAYYDSNQLHNEVESYQSGGNQKLDKLVNSLIANADEALTRGPYSVTEKTSVPPSGDKQDYWHPAPYWWPNPETEDGLPYVCRDGERVPGTEMYSTESEKYDRTRLQRAFDDSTMLALAWQFSGKEDYARHAVNILDHFFINSETRMNPHLKYAQVRLGHNENVGYPSGIIEMKDMYYYLDAVRLLARSGVLPDEKLESFREWLYEYLQWLKDADQGIKEARSHNNHGIYYDLQVAAIASFLDDKTSLFERFEDARARLQHHFNPDGSQPHELSRTNTAHYCSFNLQGWINLAKIASQWGWDFWSLPGQNNRILGKASEWLLAHTNSVWPYQQIEEFDHERWGYIYFTTPGGFIQDDTRKSFPEHHYDVKPRFDPHDGIAPYWNLGFTLSSEDRNTPRKIGRSFAVKSLSYSNPEKLANEVKDVTEGMMSAQAYLKLFEYARTVPEGDIVDVGTGQGASTISLALGLQKMRGGSLAKVYAIDQFYQDKAKKPHPYNLLDYPENAVEKNVESFTSNLEHFGVEDVVVVHPGKVEEVAADLPEEPSIGLLSLDTDGYIDRDFYLFYDKIVPGGFIVIDDYAEHIEAYGKKNMDAVAGMGEEDIRQYVQKMESRLNGGARILGKQMLTYRLAQHFMKKGIIESIELEQNTLFTKKCATSRFSSLISESDLETVKNDIREEFVEKVKHWSSEAPRSRPALDKNKAV